MSSTSKTACLKALSELQAMAQMPQAKRLRCNSFAAALEAAGSPQFSYSRIQVIGTNGKGSTAFFLAKLIAAHGLKCGLYTSPHLVDIRERIAINGGIIAKDDFGRIYAELKPIFEKFSLTHFERLTLLAAEYFKRENADFAVLETGIGGAGDAVTFLGSPTLLFTSVSLEHRDMLGGTLAEIAAKKSAPLRQCMRAFAAPQVMSVAGGLLLDNAARSQAILSTSEAAKAVLLPDASGTGFAYKGMKFTLPMPGAHYAQNAVLALETAEYILGRAFDLTTAARELKKSFWPGRLQRYRFKNCNPVLVSCAHNDESLDADIPVIQDLLRQKIFAGGKLRILSGISGKRDGKAFIKKISALGGDITVTKIPGHAAGFENISAADGVSAIEDIHTAARQVIGPHPERRGGVVVIGSIYLAGALLGILGGKAIPKQ